MKEWIPRQQTRNCKYNSEIAGAREIECGSDKESPFPWFPNSLSFNTMENTGLVQQKWLRSRFGSSWFCHGQSFPAVGTSTRPPA